MSDLGDFGSHLPSYPTLPSPPKSMDHHYQSELASDPTPTISTPMAAAAASHVSLHQPHFVPPSDLRWAALDDVGYPSWNQSVVDPVTSGLNQQYPQPLNRRSIDSDNSHSTPPDPLSLISSSNSLLSSDGSSSAAINSSSVPIYATVRKPHSSAQHTAAQTNVRQRTVSGSPFTAPITSGIVNLSLSHPPLIQSSPAASSTNSTATLALRVQHLEQLCGKMKRERSEMEEEFGRQRKSFMNQMARSDAQLSLGKHNADKYSKEVQELSKQVLFKDEELQNVTIAAGITEATLRERFDTDRVKYEEEIASLRKIVSGNHSNLGYHWT